MNQPGSLPPDVKSRLRLNLLVFIPAIAAVLISIIFVGIVALNLWQLIQVVRRSRGDDRR